MTCTTSAARAVFRVNERSNAIYEVTLVDENDAPIAASDLTTLTLTLRDRATGEIINGRDRIDVLNANGATVDEEGRVEWQLFPDDNPILHPSVIPPGRHERHVMRLRWTFSEGRAGVFESFVDVRRRLIP